MSLPSFCTIVLSTPAPVTSKKGKAVVEGGVTQSGDSGAKAAQGKRQQREWETVIAQKAESSTLIGEVFSPWVL